MPKDKIVEINMYLLHIISMSCFNLSVILLSTVLYQLVKYGID